MTTGKSSLGSGLAGFAALLPAASTDSRLALLSTPQTGVNGVCQTNPRWGIPQGTGLSISITHRFTGYRAMWWVVATTDILSASGLPCLLVVVQSFWVTTPWPCIDMGNLGEHTEFPEFTGTCNPQETGFNQLSGEKAMLKVKNIHSNSVLFWDWSLATEA